MIKLETQIVNGKNLRFTFTNPNQQQDAQIVVYSQPLTQTLQITSQTSVQKTAQPNNRIHNQNHLGQNHIHNKNRNQQQQVNQQQQQFNRQ